MMNETQFLTLGELNGEIYIPGVPQCLQGKYLVVKSVVLNVQVQAFCLNSNPIHGSRVRLTSILKETAFLVH